MIKNTVVIFFIGIGLCFPRFTAGQSPDKAAAALQKARTDATAAEQAAAKATQALAQAEKDKAGKEALAATTAALKAARARLHAARQTLLAEQAWSARLVVREAEQAKLSADRALAAKKPPKNKAAAQKVVAEKTAALIKAQDAAAQAHALALGGLKPITSKQWDYARARHLLFRAGFGGSPEAIERLVKMGPHSAVNFLVEYHQRPAANIELGIASWEKPLAYEDRLHVEAKNQLGDDDGTRNVNQHAAMVRWWVQRLLESPRPLEEKLVLFWHNHFVSSYRTLGDAYMMYQQNNLFRRYADNFDALTHGIVQDPGIIRYLNNDDNVKGNNNENLGRELLELFTMGEENSAAHRKDGYTEKDVRDGNTRALTGATYEHYASQYRFYQTRHDTRPKTLLGKTGNWGPHEAVDIMLAHPATARYIAKRLWQYFAYWEPEPEVLDKMAHVLRENGYRIRPFLQNLFLSEEFYSSRTMAAQVKSPVDLLAGTMKSLSIPGNTQTYQNIRFLLASMGQSLFDPPNVAGWVGGRDWINTNLLMARYTATAKLVKDCKVNFVALLKDHKLKDSAAVVDHLVRRCLLTDLTAAKRQTLIEFLGPLPPSTEWAGQAERINARLQALMILLVSSPEYQVS